MVSKPHGNHFAFPEVGMSAPLLLARCDASATALRATILRVGAGKDHAAVPKS